MPFPTTLFTLLTFALFSSDLMATNPIEDPCAHPDYAALESFYQALDGDNWVDKTGWLEDCEPCQWYGVRCDQNNRVTMIGLRDNGLNGTIPSTVGDFEFLEVLSLSINELGGNIPAELFSLDRLFDISLNDNQLVGGIPAAIGDQETLVNFRLDGNALSGAIPAGIQNHQRLRWVYLSDNFFSGDIPAGLGDITTLNFLDMRNNELTGCLPEDLRNRCGETGFLFDGNDGLPWSGDFSSFCTPGFGDQIGAPCNDGDPTTSNDVIGTDCACGTSGVVATSHEEGVADLSGSMVGIDEPTVGTLLGGKQTPTVAPVAIVQGLSIFPNPVSGNTLTVTLPDFAGAGTVRLLSITGSVIISQPTTGETTQLSVPELEPGLYLVEAVVETGRVVRKVMIQ
jgi:hypothetical protein